jgi:hypothetical protein
MVFQRESITAFNLQDFEIGIDIDGASDDAFDP